MKKLLSLIAVLSVSFNVLALDLVKDGKATGEFILPNNPHKAVTYAVGDIRHWIHEITGVNVPILDKPSSASNTKVYLGTAHASDFKADLDKLGKSDGYAIRAKGNNVYVFGTRPRGTLFGIYSFLERNSDIIWARPNRRIGTIFGKTKTLSLTQTSAFNKPVFPIRYQGGHFRPHHSDTLVWQIRNTLNQSKGEYRKLDLVNSVHDVPYWRLARTLKDKKYLEKNPEIFSYIKKYGKRDGKGVCYMNPKLDEIYFKELIDYLEKSEKSLGTKIEYINSHMGDSWQCCECDLCLAPIKLEDGSFLKPTSPDPYKDLEFRSTQYYMFYSRICEMLKKVRPDVKMCVLAYIYSAPPPRVKPHPDLLVIFAPYPTSSMHFPMDHPNQNPTWRKRFEKWLTITKRFGSREYYSTKTIAPLALTAKADLTTIMNKQDKDNVIITTEFLDDIGAGTVGWDLSAMDMWIIARIYWDPTQDMTKLREYFIKRAYREAAVPMKKYYDLILKSWTHPDDKTVITWHVGAQHIYENVIVKKGLEKECLGYLKEAVDMAKHPHVKTQISRIYENLRSVNKSMSKLIISSIPEMMQDGDQFGSVQWEKPLELENYKRPYLYKQPNRPSETTIIESGHDNKNVYVRFTMSSPDVGSLKTVAKSTTETFPKGDHVELWFYSGKTSYLFAFNQKGAIYDAKNMDKSWSSKCQVVTQKTDIGWDAIVVIPMQALGLESGKKTNLKWSSLRNISSSDKTELNTYGGMELHNKKFPVIFD